jgi:hypothetical protein
MDKSILVLPRAFSSEYCSAVIDYFDQAMAVGLGHSRQDYDPAGPLSKQDTSVAACQHLSETSLTGSRRLVADFAQVFWQDCYPRYVAAVPTISQLQRHAIYHYKIQRTRPGEGYHVWHSEVECPESCRRILAWTLYLNTVDCGGETEFLHQHLRVQPEVGTVLIWPAYFTHQHRGNPPINCDKYIVTGWVEF